MLQHLDFLVNDVIGADGPLGVNGLLEELTGGTVTLHNGSAHGLAFHWNLAHLANATLTLDALIARNRAQAHDGSTVGDAKPIPSDVNPIQSLT